MEKDRDQLTPDEPEDRVALEGNRGQGTGGTGHDRLPEEPTGLEGVDDEEPTMPTGPGPVPT